MRWPKASRPPPTYRSSLNLGLTIRETGVGMRVGGGGGGNNTYFIK